MLPTVPSSLTANGDWSTLRAGVGSLEPAKRPERRGGGEIAAWRDGGWFFLLGGGEPVNAAMMNTLPRETRLLATRRHVPSTIRSESARCAQLFIDSMLVDAYGSDNSDGSGDECAPQSQSQSTSTKPNKPLSRSLPVPSNSSGSGIRIFHPPPTRSKAQKAQKDCH
jgi:hypothetical protein